jgi:PBP4 family serine-type D-alanyl-D-alanine carboxypeptidase
MKRSLAVVCGLVLMVSWAQAQAPQAKSAAAPAKAEVAKKAAKKEKDRGKAKNLAKRVEEIVSRPEFQHAVFGVEFYSLDSGKVIYSLNADQLFLAASTTKLVTEGTALGLLGADYRFHTRVYRTGPIAPDGTLEGDLVLVASGDPNLSGRIQPDGTLAFENEDHSYGGPDARLVAGDPLMAIREMARQVAAKGIKRIAGQVVIDTSLFPEGERELGTSAIVSPIVVNDNLVDVIVTPGTGEGAPATVTMAPPTAYLRIENQARTGAAGSRAAVRLIRDTANPDGTHSVVCSGTLPPGPPVLLRFMVQQPSRFAQIVLSEALNEQGIVTQAVGGPRDIKALAASYSPENLVAEHVSPPLSEEMKVTLKVSQNLHATLMPFIVGAVLGPKNAPAAPGPGRGSGRDISQAGFDLSREFLQKAGLDVSGASQGDGAGGATSAFFSPDFMARYLAYMAGRPDFAVFEKALPILGRDGTLWNIQADSPAAGHVLAKTGTFGAYDSLNRRRIVTAKGLAGYITTSDGRRLAFAAYVNRVGVPPDVPDATTKIVGQALGEIAAAAYEAKP